MEPEHDPLLAADLLLAVGVDEERERRPVGAGGRLDDPRDEVLLGRRDRSTRGSRRMPSAWRPEVQVAAVVDALELLPAEREPVLDVDRLLGVVGQLVRGVLAEAQPLRRDAVALVPRPPPAAATPRSCRGAVRPDEVLHLHLLELAHPEDEVAGADLVAERLADLGDPERDLLARALLDVLEVDVRALRRLGPQVDDRRLVLDRAHVRLEHEVEAARREAGPVDRAPRPEPLDDRRVGESVAVSSSAPGSSSSRKRRWQVAHSTSGSLNEPTWPDVTQTCGCMRIPASRPTMSSRSWTIARHQARLTLFFSSTPSGP